jgi:hypothetical protein
MSEHIQPAPSPHAAHTATAEAHERTPGVSYEGETFNFALIIKVGIGLAVTAAVIHVVVWWLLRGLEKIDTLPAGSMSTLALDDAKRPLGQRLDNVPPPHLEGIERESSLLILRVDESKEERFFMAPNVRVRIGENEKARLFELREGQQVTVAYHMPGGVSGGLGVVSSVTSPPVKAEKRAEPELPDVTRTLTGTVVKVEPRSIAAAREWAEVQKDRYGWMDRQKEIVHIPVEQAMKEVLQSSEFRSKDGKKKGDGRTASPSRSSSGREPRGGKP